MADDIAVPIIGAFIIVGFVIFLYLILWRRRQLNLANHRAMGVAKVLVSTHGTKSWNQIEREFTENNKAGLSEDATHDIIADAYEDDTIEELESANKYAGTHSTTSDFRNEETLSKYLEEQGNPAQIVAQREAFKEKQTEALAISIVLNLIRRGHLKREINAE